MNTAPSHRPPSHAVSDACQTAAKRRAPQSSRAAPPVADVAQSAGEQLAQLLRERDGDALQRLQRSLLRGGLTWGQPSAKVDAESSASPKDAPSPETAPPAPLLPTSPPPCAVPLASRPTPLASQRVAGLPPPPPPPRREDDGAAPYAPSAVATPVVAARPPPPRSPSLREMVLEEEVRALREQMDSSQVEARLQRRALEGGLAEAHRRIEQQRHRIEQLQSNTAAATAAAAAAAAERVERTGPSPPPPPLASLWEGVVGTLLELCEGSSNELMLLLSAHESGEAERAQRSAAAAEAAAAGAIDAERRAADLEAASAAMALAMHASLAEAERAQGTLQATVGQLHAEASRLRGELDDERRARRAAEAALEGALRAACARPARPAATDASGFDAATEAAEVAAVVAAAAAAAVAEERDAGAECAPSHDGAAEVSGGHMLPAEEGLVARLTAAPDRAPDTAPRPSSLLERHGTAPPHAAPFPSSPQILRHASAAGYSGAAEHATAAGYSCTAEHATAADYSGAAELTCPAGCSSAAKHFTAAGYSCTAEHATAADYSGAAELTCPAGCFSAAEHFTAADYSGAAEHISAGVQGDTHSASRASACVAAATRETLSSPRRRVRVPLGETPLDASGANKRARDHPADASGGGGGAASAEILGGNCHGCGTPSERLGRLDHREHCDPRDHRDSRGLDTQTRASSCSEYLSWRRQVHELVPLPAPIRGVASSATWGLSSAPVAATPAAARSRLGSEAHSHRSTPAAREFARGVGQLQSELNDLLSDL